MTKRSVEANSSLDSTLGVEVAIIVEVAVVTDKADSSGILSKAVEVAIPKIKVEDEVLLATSSLSISVVVAVDAVSFSSGNSVVEVADEVAISTGVTAMCLA